jgi:hypothetical protein
LPVVGRVTDSKTVSTSSSDVVVRKVAEQLHRLYQWLLECEGSNADRKGDDDDPERAQLPPWHQYDTVDELIARIHNHMERFYANMQDLQQYQSTEAIFRRKRKSNDKIRNSLKEAVLLLRPLQDTVTKLEKEKKQVSRIVRNVTGTIRSRLSRNT